MRKGSFRAALIFLPYVRRYYKPKTFATSSGSGQAMKCLEPGTINE